MGYDKTNRGGIWLNTEKKTDKHPDYKGSLNVEGNEYWISCWKRSEDGNRNAPLLAIAVTEKKERKAHQPRDAALDYVKDLDIPF